jgi:hypothetical protein
MLLLLTLILVSSAWFLRAPGRRAAIRTAFQWLVRRVRIELGEHRLEDLATQMIELAIASSVPSVTRTYVPVELCFGISSDDDRRWSALLPLVASELAELIAARATTLGYTVLATPRVSFATSGKVRPGHATIIRAAVSSREAAPTTPMVAVS